MHIRLQEIPEGDSVVEGTIQFDDPGDDSVRFAQGVRCKAEIHRGGDQVQAKVSFAGDVSLRCSRCLKQISSPIEGSVWLYHGADLNTSTDDDGKIDDEVGLYYNKELDEFDVEEAVRDEVLIEVPMMPLCSVDCTGGEFLRTDEPRVAPEVEGSTPEGDPRWAPLKKLQKKKDQ